MTTPTTTPLDEERARLRKAGYTDEEISKYLVERLHGASQQSTAGGAGAPVQMPMTGVLGNASAVLSHAKGTIPVLKGDLANLRNSTAPTKSRTKSALKLAGAAVIIGLLGFVVYQEWQQHVINQTEITNSAADVAREQLRNVTVDPSRLSPAWATNPKK